MKKYFICISFFLVSISAFSQNFSASEVLDKSIAYHDPNSNWNTFDASFQITMETPNKPPRVTDLKINLAQEYFYAKAARDTNSTVFIVQKNTCEIVFNGSKIFSDETKKKYRLTCDRAKMYKNYYTYLYGLPMKLKDPGTIIDDKVERKTFKGKEYLVIKVSYEEEVGSDVWYFYFNPQTYAMEVYQFFHIDKVTKKEKGGEYILLSGEEQVNGIEIPKIRVWYTNEEEKYLGTDILNNK